MHKVCHSNTEEQQRWKCVIQVQRSSSTSSFFLNNYRGAAVLVLCYSKTEEQQCTKCVILIQRSSNAGSVLFKYRGAAVLVVCYSYKYDFFNIRSLQ